MNYLVEELIDQLYSLDEFSREFCREETKDKVREVFYVILKPYYEGWKAHVLQELSDSGQDIEAHPIRYEQQNPEPGPLPEEPMNFIITGIKAPEGY